MKMRVKFGFLASVIAKQGDGTYDAVKNFREANIKKILKQIGDRVESRDAIVEVETDKVNMEVSLADLCKESGGVIVVLNYTEDEGWQYGGEEKLPNGDIMLLPELGYIETGEVSDEPLPREEANEEPRSNEPRAEEEQKSDFDLKKSDFKDSQRVRAAPAARRLAREAGIDINALVGSGPGGRIMRADVEQKAAAKGKQQVVDGEKRKETEEKISPKAVLPAGVILLAPSREDLTIAHNLERGSRTVIAAGEPVWKDTLEEYDLGKVREIRSKYAKEFEKAFGVPLHMSSPLLLAVARTLRLKDFWIFNGYWHVEDSDERNKDKVALYTSVNMGISIDLGIPREIDLEKKTISGPRLRIATLRDAHDLSLKEFLKQHHDLMARASNDIRAKKLSQTTLRDWTGWTFIFNNVGAARHRRGNSLFTPNMSAMLNMGVIGKDGKTPLQIFFDHRMIDGVPATLFVEAVYTELMERVLGEIEMACAAVREK